mmetsp:Transcript_35418/g.83960  ORF Transcript_35418/g.83960 Transcript_35418/m.83960 type:complete len:212 (-) Transcript_35418:3039-3674(-)
MRWKTAWRELRQPPKEPHGAQSRCATGSASRGAAQAVGSLHCSSGQESQGQAPLEPIPCCPRRPSRMHGRHCRGPTQFGQGTGRDLCTSIFPLQLRPATSLPRMLGLSSQGQRPLACGRSCRPSPAGALSPGQPLMGTTPRVPQCWRPRQAAARCWRRWSPESESTCARSRSQVGPARTFACGFCLSHLSVRCWRHSRPLQLTVPSSRTSL